jgi:3',5'-cyclic AMP phosphodiesterase CpdA
MALASEETSITKPPTDLVKTPSETPAQPKLLATDANILHFSDIHFTYGFHRNRWNTLWQNAVQVADSINPDVIIVSGDFVNSPSRWALRGARRKIADLEKVLKARRASDRQDRSTEHSHSPQDPAQAIGAQNMPIGPITCKYLLCVPGNHDTRIFGIFPVSWVYPVLAVIFAGALGIWSQQLWPVPSITISVVAALLLLARLIFIGKFEQYFGVTPKVTRMDDLKLEILCFDSATTGPYWAQGTIPPRQFVDTQQELDKIRKNAQPFLCLGVLHHHALPIPYEHSQEPMMTLRNAGAFLKEATLFGVSLVLHGHRHRFSFSRVTVEAHTKIPAEIAVLSTGSPTASTENDHNFNLISINRWGAIKITPYWSRGGSTFQPEESFFARSVSDSAREYYRLNTQRQDCFCEKMITTVDINADGDGRRLYEYRGFRPLSRNRDNIPGRIEAEAGIGHLERIHLKEALRTGKSVSLFLQSSKRVAQVLRRDTLRPKS